MKDLIERASKIKRKSLRSALTSFLQVLGNELSSSVQQKDLDPDRLDDAMTHLGQFVDILAAQPVEAPKEPIPVPPAEDDGA